MEDKSIAWIFEFENTVPGASDSIVTRPKLFYCPECDRLWENTGLHGRLEYFTRKDLAFLGFKQRICKHCK